MELPCWACPSLLQRCSDSAKLRPHIVTHIVAASVWWFYTKMGEGSANLASLELWDHGVCEEGVDPLHSAAELVDGLERTWQMIQNALPF